jgi:hypothetical protein
MVVNQPYWSPKFKRERTNDGARSYWFHAEPTELRSAEHPFAVEGDVLYANNPNGIYEGIFTQLPEEVDNPSVQRQIYEAWLSNCAPCFTKPPTIEQCLANTQTVWDSNAPVVVLDPEEENEDWAIIWLPTIIKVDTPVFQIHWAPTAKKTPTTRIPEDGDQQSVGRIEIDLQSPERTYTINARPNEVSAQPNGAGAVNQLQQTAFLQELKDIQLPLCDSPPLRLDGDTDIQREKLRRRIRDARIRAKLARYRAERLSQHYEDRYGVYPEEDEEEAQTEFERSDSD